MSAIDYEDDLSDQELADTYTKAIQTFDAAVRKFIAGRTQYRLAAVTLDRVGREMVTAQAEVTSAQGRLVRLTEMIRKVP